MKNLARVLLAGLLIFSASASQAQVDIVTESFETDGSGGVRYTVSPAHANDGANDYWDRNNDAGFGAGALTGEDGSYYLGAEDVDATGTGDPGAVDDDVQIDLNTVNIAGYTSLTVSMYCAANSGNEFDQATDDGIDILVSIDGGGYAPIGAFKSTSTFNVPLQEDTDLDGTGDGTALSLTFQDFTWNVGSTGSTLDLRIVITTDGNDEEIFIDNIRVSGVAGSGVSTGAIAGPFCVTSGAGASVTVPYTVLGSINGGNTFTAELSNASGSFASPTVIGSVAGTTSGSINATIPAGTASGTGYRIRVNSSDPAQTGTDNGADFEIVLGPQNVSAESATAGNTQVTVSWTPPSTCYDEIMVVGRAGASVIATPSGDGTAYTANSTFGSGTNLGSSQYVVYKGGASSDVVTGLTNGTSYCFKIFVRKGTVWSTGLEDCATPNTSTVFDKGDFALVAVNSNRAGCGGGSGEDEISFVCFKDILSNDSFHFTDNGYQRTTTDRWGSTEGVVLITRTGGTISAGTVVTIRVDNSGNVSFVSPDASWTATKEYNSFNLNSGGDQVWFMQDGTWTNTATHQATYDGNVLFGFSTNGVWNDFGSSTQQSGLYPTMDCFSMAPTGVTDFNKYTGPTTATNQRTWLVRFSTPGNWTSSANCTDYDALAPNYSAGYSITVTPGGFTNGIWNGSTSSDWFDCLNWQDLDIPTLDSDVLIPSSGVTNEPTIGAAGAEGRSLTVETGRTLTINDASSTLEVAGNITNDGAISHTAGSVTISGDDSNINANAISFNDFTIDKNVNQSITLNTDITVTGGATFTQGYVVSTTSNTFTIANGATVSGASDASHVNGPVNKIGSTDFTFPVGDGTYYRPAGISTVTSGGATSQFQATYVSNTPQSDGYARTSKAGTLDHVSNCEYWVIDEVGTGSPGATVELSWDDPASCGVTQLADLRVAWWNGFQWRDQGNSSTSGSTTTGTILANVANGSFSPFTLASTIAAPDNPLPVELLTFDARFNGAAVDLEWITQTEINNDYFTVERSADGLEFEEIAIVSGAGSSFEALSYMLKDVEPLIGLSYYRLKQTDFDGQFVYSNLVPVYVNEVKETLEIDFVVGTDSQVRAYLKSGNAHVRTVEVFDMVGQLVYRKNMTGRGAVTSLSIPAHYFKGGMYVLRVSDGTHTATKKFTYSSTSY